MQTIRPTRLEIDLDAICSNYRALRAAAGGSPALAVVKADAYGHGAVPVARALRAAGADMFAVALIEEGIELREAGIEAPILMLGATDGPGSLAAAEYGITEVVFARDALLALEGAAKSLGVHAKAHLKIDTGMNRIGVRHDEVVAFMTQVSFHRALDLVGTFTHFATADCAETLDFQIQVKRFIEAVNALRVAGIDPGIVHAANSAAAIRYPDVQFDMVRLGISLYGFHPCQQTRTMIDLRPAMSVHARITDARLVPMSEGVSYGMNYRSPGSVKICTVPIGYADGLRRGLSGCTDFIVEGQRFPQVGTICMDQCMFEVDLRTYGARRKVDPQIGDEVIIVGRQGDSVVTIDDLANRLGTVQHEVAIGFGCSRMPRVYV